MKGNSHSIQKLAMTLTVGAVFCFAITAAGAEAANNVPPLPTEPAMLTGQHVFQLMLAAVIGSLGTIGLLIGIDKVLQIVLRHDGSTGKQYSADSIVKILPLVIYGITVVLVVLAVLLLAVLKTISAEGTLGILASIVGYVLGKNSTPSGTSLSQTAQDGQSGGTSGAGNSGGGGGKPA